MWTLCHIATGWCLATADPDFNRRNELVHPTYEIWMQRELPQPPSNLPASEFECRPVEHQGS